MPNIPESNQQSADEHSFNIQMFNQPKVNSFNNFNNNEIFQQYYQTPPYNNSISAPQAFNQLSQQSLETLTHLSNVLSQNTPNYYNAALQSNLYTNLTPNIHCNQATKLNHQGVNLNFANEFLTDNSRY